MFNFNKVQLNIFTYISSIEKGMKIFFYGQSFSGRCFRRLRF